MSQTSPETETVMKREDLLNRLDRMIAGTTVMPFTTSMYLEVMQSCADYLRGHAQTPAAPTIMRKALEEICAGPLNTGAIYRGIALGTLDQIAALSDTSTD